MRTIVYDWLPRNRITTPLEGSPAYVNSGIIKAVTKTGEKISIAQIDYQEFDEENFQYVFIPYWEIIDSLPSNIFQGIPGLDMDLRLNQYYRVNYIPTFITERTPSENREDLWALLKSVGLTYYDRFEWLLRTTMTCGNDNLIVERRRAFQTTQTMTPGILSSLQYGDKVIVDSISNISDTAAGFNSELFSAVTKGVDIVDQQGNTLIGKTERATILPILMAQRNLIEKEHSNNKKNGIELAKKEGKYTGRKPVQVDEMLLRQVDKELKAGIITIDDALRRTKISSKSTYYRKVKALGTLELEATY